MGYYSNYSLKIKTGNTDLIAEFVSNYKVDALDDYGQTQERATWYEYEEQFRGMYPLRTLQAILYQFGHFCPFPLFFGVVISSRLTFSVIFSYQSNY